ncbi:ABC transporter permease [Paramicrobacterium agarici]|uniref:Nucleoside ABC transporter membrane protein n=1 Tax=Paramicrobacterium agarici TaxID=630514 RepID=A0A2A9E0P4_9MICO|nr:ABC transporter permease [Microbacterium agarici]PFG31945.1 nucleoside ABC transporter membrane protein [Microbacterium agarici]TQO21836.1 nucleoside ABC transporter membrane protein [Microbacterium agarici]
MTDVETAKKPDEAPRSNQLASQIMNSSTVMTVLAVVISLVVGAVLIAVTDSKVQATAGYFFARPTDMLAAIWDAVSGAYIALFNGAIYNTNRDSFLGGIKSITDTLHHATPLIAGGLGVALAFRAGLFNIGGRGQMLVAAGAAGWVGFSFHLPVWIHLPLAVIAGIAAGALWGGLVGYLKARTGAHEVILTIMLNYVAFYLISWMLRTPGLLQAPGTVNPESAPILPSAILPPIFGDRYNLHAGFILVILATVFVWWLLNRSNLGFKFRAVGENPNAARTAGINVKSMYIWAMLIAGGLMGIAGVSQVLGTITSGFSSGIDAGIGFDAITVALLGRSTPWGTFAAGVLFGAFKAGGYAMQAGEGIPIDIVLVVQSVIVLFIAAPPLVRSIFFIPKPGSRGSKRNTPNVSKEVAAK